CLFEFQAEDGIRVFHVTGVQTCALPILSQVSNAMAAQFGAQLLGTAGAISNSRYTGLFNQLYGIGYQVGSLSFSRKDELAADKRSEERRVGKEGEEQRVREQKR